jgi:phosphoribosylamine-glycine ligase
MRVPRAFHEGRIVRFIVATQDYAGLGFACRLREEGHDVVLACNPAPHDQAEPTRSAFERVGEGMVDKIALADLMQRRETLRDAYWIWDFNHSSAENEQLRGEGFRVLGGGTYAETMEHDRAACVGFVEKYGLRSPPSARFETHADARSFLEAHPDLAYVYKPDTGAKYETFVPECEEPEEANQELRAHLATGEARGPFILQERKDGVELNVEAWIQRGEPIFAFVTLEVKRKFVFDLGPLCGCALDFAFVVPLSCRAIADSVGKLFPAYREMQYTGFADANLIAGKDGLWFLEKCERFGYNSHPNLFWNLAKSGTGETLAAWIDGHLEPEFAEGFGASVTMGTKDDVPGGEAILFPDKLAKDIYFLDAYRDGTHYRTAGYDSDGDTLIVNAHGYTPAAAWESVLKKAQQVRFPFRHYRTDGDQTNYPSAPIRRYDALKAMGYL